MAQRLVRILCPKCKKKIPIPPSRDALVTEVINSLKGYEEEKEVAVRPTEVWGAVGCEACNNTGYKGRLGVFEAILADKVIEDIIRENPSEREIRQAAAIQKIITMKQDGMLKIFKGITTFEELERVVDVAEEIATVKTPEVLPELAPEPEMVAGGATV